MRKNCKLGILSAILTLMVLLTACGHSEVESTILTTAPVTIPVEITTPPSTVPETTSVPETTEPTSETTFPAPVTEQTEPTPETTVPSVPRLETTVPPEPTEESTVPVTEAARDYVLNNNSKKFHHPTCSSVSQIKPSNRADFHGTRQELLDRGYSPCGRCKP